MPRKRQNTPDWLPKYTIPVRGWYVYRPYIGSKNGKPTFGPEKRITKIGCTPQEFFKVFEALQPKESHTIGWLLEEYNKSKKFRKLAIDTQRGYIGYKTVICRQEIVFKNGNKTTFGELSLESMSTPKIQRYIDSYAGEKSANRHIQYLSAAWNWARRRYEGMPFNPCAGVELNEETARERYIEDWEYAVVYLCAQSMRNPYFAPAMEFAYLCRARRGEIFNLDESNIKNDGIFLERSKGSMNEITLWSPALKQALEDVRLIYPKAPTPIKGRKLLHDKAGLPYTKNALDSAWQRIMKKAKTTGAELKGVLLEGAIDAGIKPVNSFIKIKESFTFHDIKAKGVTDHEKGESGHLTSKMKAVYQRKPKRVEATI